MIITFPYNTEQRLSGLNLSSGATYYFELQGIADTSAAANRMEHPGCDQAAGVHHN